MNCPRCSTELADKVIKEVGLSIPARVCPSCDGYWLAADNLRELEKTVEVRVFEWRKIPSKKKQMKPLICPSCQEKVEMSKSRNERDKKVIMDTCEKCGGIWLDGGELQAIQEEGFVAVIVNFVHWLRKTDAQ